MLATISKDISRAADLLRRGELVAIPTETVYGLGANALDSRAVAQVFSVKERPSFDPLIIHQSSAERIFQYAQNVEARARVLAAAFWPGPLTLVLPKATSVPDIVSAGLDTVAMRVPAHPLCRELLGQLDFPLAAPSANPFGFVSPTSAQHVADQLGDKISMILDGGPSRVGLESTIVGFPNGRPTVYRKGGLATEDIEAVLGEKLYVREHGSSRPQAPGMLSKHYSPGCAVTLWERFEDDPELPKRDAIIVFGRGGNSFSKSGPGKPDVYDLSPSANLNEAASTLFSTLRALHAANYRDVAVELVPENGLGRAINDRLRRAAATD